MEEWNKSLLKGKFKEIIEDIAACNIGAVERQVLIKSKKEDRGDVIEALVVILRLMTVLFVLHEYSIEKILQLLFPLISKYSKNKHSKKGGGNLTSLLHPSFNRCHMS